MMKISSFMIVIGSISLWVCTSSTTENNVTLGESINGQTIIKLGRKMNKPMLTFLGMAMQNLHKCEEWTLWTDCEAKQLGSFGTRTRTRKCHAAIDDNGNNDSETTETDWSLCEGPDEEALKIRCPSNYNFTKHGFCIKLNTDAKSHSEADGQCQLEGGYLINIDSDKKYSDVKDILKGGTLTTWVGGRRKNSTSEWEFIYGKNNKYYNNYWYSSSYPTNGVLCLVIQNYLWYTTGCSYQKSFLCEIV